MAAQCTSSPSPTPQGNRTTPTNVLDGCLSSDPIARLDLAHDYVHDSARSPSHDARHRLALATPLSADRYTEPRPRRPLRINVIRLLLSSVRYGHPAPSRPAIRPRPAPPLVQRVAVARPVAANVASWLSGRRSSSPAHYPTRPAQRASARVSGNPNDAPATLHSPSSDPPARCSDHRG
jgi:hypothetical protein